jgi:long-subunit acyl-CoA synthetase (AMP-forming)
VQPALKPVDYKAANRVVLLAENSPEWIIVYLAALAAETTVVLLDPALTAADLEELIERSDPRAVLVSQRQYEKLIFPKDFKLPILDIGCTLTLFNGISASSIRLFHLHLILIAPLPH